MCAFLFVNFKRNHFVLNCLLYVLYLDVAVNNLLHQSQVVLLNGLLNLLNLLWIDQWCGLLLELFYDGFVLLQQFIHAVIEQFLWYFLTQFVFYVFEFVSRATLELTLLLFDLLNRGFNLLRKVQTFGDFLHFWLRQLILKRMCFLLYQRFQLWCWVVRLFLESFYHSQEQR